ncbi:MAG: UDP-N-acetylmuramoyl-L-alanine--D-glutamate ligase [Firmicutes bacterium]|nr:UDP-N-acetylmuramoyl-L-alanine--D-glutamate ligase [Bacillota bacterium]
MNFQGQRVAVVGLGKSNLPLIRWLRRKGAEVVACDRLEADQLGDRIAELRELGVREFHLGAGYLDRLPEFGIICLTPGIPKHLPPIQAARARGAWITGEIPLVLALCRALVVGVTGSAGKTTTTTLVGEILKASGRQVYVGGNIGTPLIEQVESLPPDAVVVLELSSFQLQLATHSPRVAVLTNISPNHLDVHASMEEYVEAKKNIYRYQGPEGRVVINADHPGTVPLIPEVADRAVRFSLRGDPGGRMAAFLEDGNLVWRVEGHRQPVLRREELPLLGDHNVANALAALAAAFLAGGTFHAARQVLTRFQGVEHRLEPVRVLDGVRYINDSKATAPAETLAALAAIRDPIVLIAGGSDKGIPFDDLAAALVGSHVHTLILTGATAGKIRRAVEAAAAARGVAPPRLVEVPDMAAAVQAARAAARPGDVVLLSPACASFDRYRSFEERGRHFKELVMALA